METTYEQFMLGKNMKGTEVKFTIYVDRILIAICKMVAFYLTLTIHWLMLYTDFISLPQTVY